jgi:exonuclease III
VLGTAIIMRNMIHLINIATLPSGRAIAADWTGLGLINIYGPSGTAARTEREQCYNTELPYLLQHTPQFIILGGDLNCIQDLINTTGHFQTSRALATLLEGLTLKDSCSQNPVNTV